MEATLKSIYNQTRHKYKLELLAGHNGLDMIIGWVHLIEDVTTTDFIRGNELIITTGLRYKGEKWMQTFIEDLISVNAKGLIVNVGKYIEEVPDPIVKFCDRMNFPLFIMPWEIHLVDIMQDYCNRIIQSDRILSDEADMFLKALLSPEKKDEFLPYFKEHGYQVDGDYHLLIIKPEGHIKSKEQNHILKQMQINMSNMLHRYHIRFNILLHTNQVIVLFDGYEDKEVNKNVKRLKSLLDRYHKKAKVYMVVGPLVKGIMNFHLSYGRLVKALNKAYLDEEGLCYYEKLGIERMLFEIEDQALLVSIRDSLLGELISYDKEHKTEFLSILRLYIEHNGSINAIAKASYTHRNTVSYRINKIKAMLPKGIEEVKYRLEYQMAFHIHDLLNEKNFI